MLVLEQFRVGHDRGSSHGSSRIFRFAYDEPSWVRLAQEALPLWRELEAESGVELLALPGSLDTGRDPEPLCRALESAGAEFELLEPAEVERRFGLRLHTPAVLQPQGGVAWAARILEALRTRLEVVETTRVASLRSGDRGARLETAGGPLLAGVALVCAGAWARPLLETAGIELPARVTRETVAYFALSSDRRLPSLIDWAPQGVTAVQVYGLATAEGTFKVGLHHAGPEADPDERAEPSAATVAHVGEWAARVLPLASANPIGAETCLYTTTADESFVLERHGRVVVGSACSGHAFKFAPAIGERLADLAEEALTS